MIFDKNRLSNQINKNVEALDSIDERIFPQVSSNLEIALTLTKPVIVVISRKPGNSLFDDELPKHRLVGFSCLEELTEVLYASMDILFYGKDENQVLVKSDEYIVAILIGGVCTKVVFPIDKAMFVSLDTNEEGEHALFYECEMKSIDTSPLEEESIEEETLQQEFDWDNFDKDTLVHDSGYDLEVNGEPVENTRDFSKSNMAQ